MKSDVIFWGIISFLVPIRKVQLALTGVWVARDQNFVRETSIAIQEIIAVALPNLSFSRIQIYTLRIAVGK